MKNAARMTWVAIVMIGFGLSGCSNRTPSLFPIGNKEIETGKTIEIDIKAVDSDGDPLKYAVKYDNSLKPSNAIFKQVGNGATFSWTPLASDAGPEGQGQDFPVTFMVTDGISTASEKIIISVTLGGAGAGAPRLVSPRDYTLDLDRDTKIRISVEVRAESSSDVTLRVVQNIEGATFSSKTNEETGSIIGTFNWTPSEPQKEEKPIWSVRIGAKDQKNPEQVWDITILIKGGKKKCSGNPPIVEHSPLSDQRGSEDYAISLTATDSESSISSAVLYWNKGTTEGDFQKVSLIKGTADTWTGVIPNAGLTGDETAKISYYVCATDTDDPNAGACNLQACMPEKGRYSFTAYAPGSTTCENDGMEENNTYDKAVSLSFGQDGFGYTGDLMICPGDIDWFKVELAANDEMPALISYVKADGDLGLDLFDQNGSTLLYSGEGFETSDGLWNVGFWIGAEPDPKTYYLRVQGTASQIQKSYEIIVAKRPNCAKPNNDSTNAVVLSSNPTPQNQTNCGNTDWYKISLQKDDYLQATINFTPENGDLDLGLFDAHTALALTNQTLTLTQDFCDSTALFCSNSLSSNFEVVYQAVLTAGDYYIAVVPNGFLGNAYDISATVESGWECQDDTYEPNDTAQTARPLDYTDPGVHTYNNLVLCPGTEDWYWVVGYQGYPIDVKLLFDNPNGDIDLYLYSDAVLDAVTPDDFYNCLLDASQQTSGNEHIRFTVPGSGGAEEKDYFFQVAGTDASASSRYTLELSWE